jgi:hypothetical protein
LNKTLHFFTPNEVEAFILWAHQALKLHGHIYILTLSPSIASYRKKVLPFYMQNKEACHPFPGCVSDADSYLEETSRSDSNYRVPKKMNFFTLEDLCILFEQRGFAIEKTYSVTLPSNENPYWTTVAPEQSSLIGIKARKRYATDFKRRDCTQCLN